MSLIFSPFVGFTIQGTVSEAGLVTGLMFAILPLSGFFIMAGRRWYVWRQLPPRLIDEWKYGRVIKAEGAPSRVPPVRFSNKKSWIEILPEGVSVSHNNILAIQNASKTLEKVWVAKQSGHLFVSWRDIVEWEVDTDSDGPHYYLLNLHPKGTVRVRRFQPDRATECDLLDAVRSIGNCSIRLLCDVDCE